MPELLESISTRPATDEDLEILERIYKGTRQDEMDSWGWPAVQQDSFARMQFRARRSWYASTYPGIADTIILRGDLIAGSMTTHSSAKEVRLVDIALLPEHRNCGIGGHVISKLVKDAAALRLPVTLRVLRSSPAACLYRRLGFRDTGGDDVYLEMENDHDRKSQL